MTVRNLMKVAAGMVCATAPTLAPAEHLHHHTLQVAVEMPSGTFYQMKAKELPGKGSGEDGKILPQDTLFFIPRTRMEK